MLALTEMSKAAIERVHECSIRHPRNINFCLQNNYGLIMITKSLLSCIDWVIATYSYTDAISIAYVAS